MRDILLSGLLGTLLAVVVQAHFEHRRLKQEVVLSVMGWMADIFRHLGELFQHASFQAAGDHEYLTQEDLRRMRAELNRLSLPAELRTHVALLFGEGCDLLGQMDRFVTDAQNQLRAILEADGVPPNPHQNIELARSMAAIRATAIRRASSLVLRIQSWLKRGPTWNRQ